MMSKLLKVVFNTEKYLFVSRFTFDFGVEVVLHPFVLFLLQFLLGQFFFFVLQSYYLSHLYFLAFHCWGFRDKV